MITSTLVSYRLAANDIDTTLQRVSEQSIVARDVEYYLEHIGDVETIDDFLDDSRLFNFAMKAHGLGDMSYAKAFMRKVLEEGVDSNDSFANSLADSRYADFAKTFDFKTFEAATTSFTKTQQGTVDKYIRQTLEEQAGETNEGVRLALYFQRKAESIDNFYEILADPALSKVVRTTLGMPDAVATIDIDKQVDMISDRLDLETFQDPDALSELLDRFAALWDVNRGPDIQANGIIGLFGGTGQLGVSQDLLLQIAQLRR